MPVIFAVSKFKNMKQQFNLKKILEAYPVNEDALASLLFPKVQYPKMAFKRILKGEAFLNTQQLTTLAAFLNLQVSDLYNIDKWKGTWEDGCLTLTRANKKNIKVLFDCRTNTLNYYKNTNLVYSEIVNKFIIPFSDFLKNIDLKLQELEKK